MGIYRIIAEINDAAFPWYAAITALIFGLDFATGGILAQIGVSRTMVMVFFATSLVLKAMRYAKGARRKTGHIVKQITLDHLRATFFTLAGFAAYIWILFGYKDTARVISQMGEGQQAELLAYGLFAGILGIAAAKTAEEYSAGGDGAETPHDNFDMKRAYRDAEEWIVETRVGGEFKIRSRAHIVEYDSICAQMRAGDAVLDAGCGDGSLSILLAKKGCVVTGCDISPSNIKKAKRRAEEVGVNIHFIEGDAESLPFPDASFDCVVSCHILEHLPHFEKGLAEISRVTKGRAVIAMPTCLNPCAVIILGGDMFWTISRWTPVAWAIGLSRIILGLGGEGVEEPWGYRGDPRMTHLWRYPWRMRRAIESAGFYVQSFEASSIPLPYFEFLIPLSLHLERYKRSAALRDFGYGSIATVCKK